MSKRTDLSLAEKIALLDKIHSQPEGASHRRLAELLAMPKSTIDRLVRQEQELRQRSSQEEKRRVHPGKRKRCGKDPEVKEVLKQWFSTVLVKGVIINWPILKSKAEELAHKLGKPDFIATDGWLSRWKVRHQIKFKRAHGEKNSADVEGVQEWQSTTLPQLLLEYRPDDIYNADEIGLYY